MEYYSAPPNGQANTQQGSTGYSGIRMPGLTEQGSYDRVIWDGGGQYFKNIQEAEDIINNNLQFFRTQQRSRFLMRANIAPNVEADCLRASLSGASHIEIVVHPDAEEEHNHLTVALNSRERSVPLPHIHKMQQEVRRRVAAATLPDFTQHALNELDRCRSLGMTFDTNPHVNDIFNLWNHPFSWSKEQCEEFIREQDSSNRVFLLRDECDVAVSGVLYSEGESTEWSTLPQHQGKGYITPLLIYSNCILVRDGLSSVFAELRWNRSVTPAIKSGFRIAMNKETSWLLTNHVTIGDDLSSDPPDPWNTEMPVFGEDTDGRMLRSFAVAYLDSYKFNNEIVDAYLDSHT